MKFFMAMLLIFNFFYWNQYNIISSIIEKKHNLTNWEFGFKFERLCFYIVKLQY